MKLEDIKTENDARQALVEKVLIIYAFYYSTAGSARVELGREAIFYRDLKDYAKREFNIDTTPYDNVARKYASNI